VCYDDPSTRQRLGYQGIVSYLQVRSSSSNVDIFRKPSKRNASLNGERPSRALTTTALANRLPARAPSVR